MLKTPFWQQVAASLPSPVRERHMHELEGAERFELLLGSLIDLWRRVEEALARRIHIAPQR